MSKFSHQHYEVIATLLGRERGLSITVDGGIAIENVAGAFISEFTSDNPKFKADMFWLAFNKAADLYRGALERAEGS